MGALTLKTFPFELRGWELEKFRGIDLTDGFGSEIKLCLINKKIIQIEPGQNNTFKNQHLWLHDKGRQFFDSFTSNKVNNINNLKKSFDYIIKSLQKTIYLFELCDLKYVFTHFFIIVYENLDANLFCLLNLYSKKYSFIKLKKAEFRSFKNNLESNFLTSKSLIFNGLKKSSLCLLVSTNVRLEGSFLNVNLKQRALKGNFKCFLIGSFLSLSFNVSFLGKTTTKCLKLISEGIHFVCQDLKLAKNPFFVINSELLKRKDGYNLIEMFNYLNKVNNIKLNILNLSIFETGLIFHNKVENLKSTDLLQFSSLYLVNLTSYSNITLNKIIKANLVYLTNYTKPYLIKNLLDQNFFTNKTSLLAKKFSNYLYIPSKSLFETKNTFLTTKGLIKNTHNLINNNQARSEWKTFRTVFNKLKKKIVHLNFKTYYKTTITTSKNNKLIKFINLTYYSLRSLENKTTNKNLKPFKVNPNKLRTKMIKFLSTKIKFWLNDFFTGGKDEFSKNSLIMIKSSNIKRLETTNFF